MKDLFDTEPTLCEVLIYSLLTKHQGEHFDHRDLEDALPIYRPRTVRQYAKKLTDMRIIERRKQDGKFEYRVRQHVTAAAVHYVAYIHEKLTEMGVELPPLKEPEGFAEPPRRKLDELLERLCDTVFELAAAVEGVT